MNVYAVKEGSLVLGYYSSKAKARQALLDHAKDYHLMPASGTDLLVAKSAPMSILTELYTTEYPGHFFSISKLVIDFV